jgi:hypothetical protein
MSLPVIGALVDNLFAGQRQEDAQAFSAQQYATRYQTQTEDMKKAGINPMLSVSSGAGSQPTSSAASPGSNFTQAALTNAQIDLIKAQTRETNAKAGAAEQFAGPQAEASLNESLARVGLTTQQIGKAMADTNHVIAQIQNTKDENQKIREATEYLYQQAQLARQYQLTESGKQELLKQQALEVIAKTGLANLDIDAAKALDNLGRTSQQLKPMIEMLRMLMRR